MESDDHAGERRLGGGDDLEPTEAEAGDATNEDGKGVKRKREEEGAQGTEKKKVRSCPKLLSSCPACKIS